MTTKNVPYCYPVKIMKDGVFVRVDLFILIPLTAGIRVVPGAGNPEYTPHIDGVIITYALETQNQALASTFYHRIQGVDAYKSSLGPLKILIGTKIGGAGVKGSSLCLNFWAGVYDCDEYTGLDTDDKALNSPYVRINNDPFGEQFYPKVIIPNQETGYRYLQSINDEKLSSDNQVNYTCKVILQAGGPAAAGPEEPAHINDDTNLIVCKSGGDFVVEVEMRDSNGNPTGKKKRGKVKNLSSAGVIDGKDKKDNLGKKTKATKMPNNKLGS